MKRGDRVVTPRGPGTLAGRRYQQTWVFGRSVKRAWWLVELDSGGTSLFNPTDLTREEGS